MGDQLTNPSAPPRSYTSHHLKDVEPLLSNLLMWPDTETGNHKGMIAYGVLVDNALFEDMKTRGYGDKAFQHAAPKL